MKKMWPWLVCGVWVLLWSGCGGTDKSEPLATVLPTEIFATPVAPTVSQSQVETVAITLPPPQIIRFIAESDDLAESEHVQLTWQASGTSTAKAQICGQPQSPPFIAPVCQPVALSDTLDFFVPAAWGRERRLEFTLTVQDGPTAQDSRTVYIGLKCTEKWFFSDLPEYGVCPATAVATQATSQPFEHGQMFWLQDAGDGTGRFFVLLQTTTPDGQVHQLVWAFYDAFVPPTRPPFLPTPPAGLYTPQGHLGLLWSGTLPGSQDLQAQLGWAVAPETNYDALYQCDDNPPPDDNPLLQNCYLRDADGKVYNIHLLYGWHLMTNE